MCWICGQAPIRRWENGRGLCGKLAHRVSGRGAKTIRNAQRSKRSMLDDADEEKKRSVLMAFGRAVRSVFKREKA